MKEYSFTEMAAFKAVVETGSFVQAADRLDTTSASISRKVSALEDDLGVRLFQRTTRRVNLTEAGERYYQDIDNIFDALEEAHDRVSQSSSLVTGELKLAAPMSFGLEILSPLIPKLLAEQPDLSIDLRLEDTQTDLLSNGIDLALRIGTLSDSSLIATKLGEISFGYFASPCYLKQNGEPQDLQDLNDHHCLHYSLISRASEWGTAAIPVETRGRLSVNNGEALCEAAKQGVGVVALPRFIVARALEQGDLLEILQGCPVRRESVYAVRVSRNYTPRKVREAIDFFQREFEL